MATRFYLPNPATGPAAPISPAFAAAWHETGAAGRAGCRTVKGSTALASVIPSKVVATDPGANVLARQYVSVETIPSDRTIAGTVSAVLRVGQNASSVDAYLQMVIRVIAPDGTVRGTLYAGQTGGEPGGANGAQHNEMSVGTGSPLTRIWNEIALTAVDAVAGDHIVVEVGARMATTATTAAFAVNFGEPSGADFGLVIQQSSSSLTPWIEFSANLFGGDTAAALDTATAAAAAHEVEPVAAIPLDVGTAPAAAHDLSAAVAAPLEHAAAAAAGFDLAAQTDSSTTVPLEVATATGAAHDLAAQSESQVAATLDTATATATAFDLAAALAGGTTATLDTATAVATAYRLLNPAGGAGVTDDLSDPPETPPPAGLVRTDRHLVHVTRS